jgi:hypothetical protein
MKEEADAKKAAGGGAAVAPQQSPGELRIQKGMTARGHGDGGVHARFVRAGDPGITAALSLRACCTL